MTNPAAPLAVGDAAPAVSLPRDGGSIVTLSDMSGPVVLYFYPKDDTPGCTKEAIGFTESKAEFDALNAAIVGVSKDTPTKHDKFIAKHELKVSLGSDESGEMIESYGVWVEKNMYGKKYMGVERSTFLIGKDGKILRSWRKVKVPGHVEEVLASAKELL